MEFQIGKVSKSLNDLMRTIGYKPAYFQKGGEFSIVRQIGRSDYPRFHLYIKPSGGPGSDNRLDFENSSAQNQSSSFTFHLHLDQKKPSYGGAAGHSGDYHGEVVEEEARRIKQLLGG